MDAGPAARRSPYLAAYAFGEFFLFTGPVQTALRGLFGFHTPQDYWFPDLRSTPGAAFTLTCVLYPYVYLTSRVVFLMQGRNIGDVARTLGAGPARVFFRVLLPVARPAIAAGVVLVLMETINDIGVAEYLGVRTLTSAIYTTWINRSSLEGAAQLAMLMLVLVLALLACEQFARRLQRFHNTRATQIKTQPPRVRLTGVARCRRTCRSRDARAVRLRRAALGVWALCVAPPRLSDQCRPRQSLPQHRAHRGRQPRCSQSPSRCC